VNETVGRLDPVLKTGITIIGSMAGGEFVKEFVEGVHNLIEIAKKALSTR